MEQDHLFSIDHHIKHSVRPDFDFPKLTIYLPKLDSNSVQSPSLHLFKCLKDSRTFRFGEILYILQHRRPTGGRSEERYFHRPIITVWLYTSTLIDGSALTGK